MTPVRYPGLQDATAQFEALRPYHDALIRMQTRVKPLGPDYLILNAAQKALATACYHFTGDPYFYAGKAPR
jgi:hypothetical protein